jgi:hypothetical protein
MNLETLFSVAGVLAMAGWLVLFASPLIPHWSDRISGYIIPLLLSVGYVTLILVFPSEGDGGFGSLAEVMDLFSNPNAMMAGWVHFLAFELLIGAWRCRTARRDGMRFWLVAPCLPLTFLFGPAGFLTFSTVRILGRAKAI